MATGLTCALLGSAAGWHDIPSTGSACTGRYPEQCRVCRCLSRSTNTQGVAEAQVADGEGQETGGGPGTGGNGQADDGPWGERLFGHTAAHGGVYSTIRCVLCLHICTVGQNWTESWKALSAHVYIYTRSPAFGDNEERTCRIPFGKTLRATITSPDPQNGTFWFIIRGLEK